MSRGLTFALTELPEAMRKQAQEKLAAAGTVRAHSCLDDNRIKEGRTTPGGKTLELNGEVHTIAEWSKIKKIAPRTLNHRLNKHWTVARALNTPVVKKVRRAPKVPALSEPAERLAFHLRAEGLGGFVREHRFSVKRFWRFDFAHLPSKLAVEIDGGVYTGGRHVRGKGYENDAEKRNAAVMAGWRVLHFLPHQVKSGRAIREIKRALEEFRT